MSDNPSNNHSLPLPIFFPPANLCITGYKSPFPKVGSNEPGYTWLNVPHSKARGVMIIEAFSPTPNILFGKLECVNFLILLEDNLSVTLRNFFFPNLSVSCIKLVTHWIWLNWMFLFVIYWQEIYQIIYKEICTQAD